MERVDGVARASADEVEIGKGELAAAREQVAA